MNNITLATENITLLDNTGFDNMMGAFDGTTSVGDLIESFLYGLFGSYLNVGYLLLIGSIFYLMWHDHRSLLLPSVLILISGRLLFTFIPESVVMYVKLFALIGMTAILVKLYRDGRQ